MRPLEGEAPQAHRKKVILVCSWAPAEPALPGRRVRPLEQLCSKSMLLALCMTQWIPGRLITQHGVEDGQHLSHARDEGDLLELSRGQQALVKALMTGLWLVAVNVAM